LTAQSRSVWSGRYYKDLAPRRPAHANQSHLREEYAFRNRFAPVVHARRGVVLIHDRATDEWVSITKFEREFGVRGKQFLDRVEPYRSLEHYALVCADAIAEESIPVPQKSPYGSARREAGQP
jgi:hypothetical protein